MATNTGRARRSRAEWEAIVARYETCDLTQQAFCESEGISVASLSYWRRKLADGAEPARATPAFQEISVEPDAESAGSGWELELDLGGGHVLRIRSLP